MDRRASRARFPFRLRPAKELREFFCIEVVPHLEVGVRRGAGKLVPRAYELTVIAAEDAVADRWAQLHGDRTVVLDGEVGDAAPRIEAVGCNDRTRGAGRYARLSGAAVRARGLIDQRGVVGEGLIAKEVMTRRQ